MIVVLRCPAVTLFVVRHAHAGQRSAWTGDDRLRTLSERGEAQARSIAATLAAWSPPPATILTSPSRRCVQTVDPLAGKLGLTPSQDDRLFEGATCAEVADLLDEVAHDDAVLCSHGDVIPLLLDLLVAEGADATHPLVWQKASVWVVEGRSGDWGAARYLPPPDRR